uniref:PUA domain-containing protein n=1 Tax=Rhodosorus marinus TaxID=101924 RepID=A0A7S3A8Q9_9RHOD|mmetsp:Transcript_5801/g.24429  ORF Transcript_5801/g.24429 Transcript_5801/m.24429 type:complete len:184 (+) Transcript_5801:214-765(+)|eukprot:CAMPEP_0113969832 /NCGR_PEP_ID=MMETSP0011_2-20120614/10626_1 /TAXON_ID=101924 /ORGANISM="Rhodosorus marinus" /LENGTH=183 /DNA_ID=CAMNT_0000983713 /DNA_START=42 /DNA_END=593 /DNA_ORIENTATION=+ /assembly_acc=CAM_ASM_000156
MFKRFTAKDGISGQSQVKSSVQRGIRSKVLDQMRDIEPYIDDILPKKEKVVLAKCQNHVNVVTLNGDAPLFFNERDGPYAPSIRLLHKYPFFLPKLQVDKGAIKFVLKGADVMCPGLTSPGARMDEEVEAGKIVAIHAEGKEHALAVGLTKLSTADIRSINKGIAVEMLHHVNDGLYKTLTIS